MTSSRSMPIFMPRTVAAENLAGDQDGRLDVVADHAHLSIDDAPVERFGRVALGELRVIGHRDVAAWVDARLVPRVETLLGRRVHDSELAVDRLENGGEAAFPRRVLERIIGRLVDVGVLFPV